VLATAAALATAGACWTAYLRVHDALVSEFEHRIVQIATTAAAQVAPETVAEARTGGDESGGYLAIQVQLLTLRNAAGLDNVSLIDGSRATLVDVRAPEVTERLPSALDSLARPALARALAGTAAVSAEYLTGGHRLRAAIAPVRDGNAVTAAVAVEAEPAYAPTLDSLARRLTLIALLSIAAIVLFAALIVRAAISAARLEQRLSRAENLAAMGRLTATLAHEIKNPLAIIRGSAERLRGGDAETQRMAQFVIEEVDRLSRTVGRYLQFARGGEQDVGRGDAIAALDQTLALLEGELAARNITVERFRGAGDSATVRLDPESLKQVYLNLLLNAADASPSGGRLEVRDRAEPGRYEVEITDHGRGIAPEMLARLGSPFLTTKAQGSGLGLFLTRRLVQSSGGDLVIKSEVGSGTTCVVKLPRAGD